MRLPKGESGMDHTSIGVKKNSIVLGQVKDDILPLPKKYPHVIFLVPSEIKHALVDIGMCLDDCM